MSNFKLPKKTEIDSAISSFSKKEWLFFLGFAFVLIISTLGILESINKTLMVAVPMHGGSISEGIIGTPRFINPVLAFSDADEDMTALIYSGLMRKSSDGTLIPDLAAKYDVSKDGLVYTFTLKDNLTFQDGKPITIDDIVFTINKIKDSIIKSPHKASWDGITAEKIDAKNIKFTLKQPYASFLENTTLGILPMHVWDATPLELNTANTSPIGSGPFMVDSVNKQSSGVIDSYTLVPFKKFALGRAYIQNLNIHFYSNENDAVSAVENKTIDQISSITPVNAENLREENYSVQSSVLPRIFGLFFNQNTNHLFVDKTIVKTIDQVIDKEKIVRQVLYGYGTVIDNPIPPNLITYETLSSNTNPSREEILKKATSDLSKDGWVKGADGFLTKMTTVNKKKVATPLEFSISTSNAPELAKTAELIKEDLATVGIKVDIKTFDTGNLNQSVIRPRKYDALLFGEVINQESDLFAFWHSTQRKDPGLNVAMYANPKVDKILEDAFVTIDPQSRTKKYIQFEDEIQKDMPAVFLYSPNFIYVVAKDLKDYSMSHIISSSDRYLNAYQWYNQTENIWKIFNR